MYQVSLVGLFYLCIAGLQLAFCIVLLRHSSKPGARALAQLLAALFFYTLGTGFETLATRQVGIVFWNHVQYLGIPYFPMLLLNFVQTYYRTRLTVKRFSNGMLFGFGVLIMTLQFTYPYHQLFYTAVHYHKLDGFTLYRFEAHAFYYLNAFVQVSIAILCMFYIIHMMMQHSSVYRKQSLLLMFSILVPLAAALGVLFTSSIHKVDVVPLSLLVSMLLLMYLFASDKLFKLIPIDNQLVFDALQDGLIVLDRGQVILDINPIARSYIPDLGDWAIGCSLVEAAQRVALFHEYLCHPKSTERVLVVTHPEGTSSFLEIRRFDALSQQMAPGIEVLVLRDVTELHDIMAQLRTSNEKLKEANQLKSMVIDVMAHDLRSPLVAVKSMRQLMASGTFAANPDLWDSAGNDLDDLTDRADALIDNLLVLNITSDPSRRYPLATLDTETVIKHIPASVVRYAHKKGIHLVYDQEDVALIIGNQQLLASALRNILENAIKYSQPAQTVRLSVYIAEQSVAFIVEDDGVGISDAALAAFSHNLWGVKEMGSGGEKGPGVGLYAAKQFAYYLQGSLQIERRETIGCRAVLRLKRAKRRDIAI